jgi:membrane-bound lytic murein transglycosylase D
MNRRLTLLLLWMWILPAACGHLIQNQHIPPSDVNQNPLPSEPAIVQQNPPTGSASEDDAQTDPTLVSESDSKESEADESAAPDTYENNENPNDDADEKNTDFPKNIQSLLDDALDLCQVSQDFWQKGELENALDALDQAYALILKVEPSDQTKFIQQKEDLRYMISKRILEIYASRNIVVNGSHNAIPRVMNKHVQDEVERFTEGNEKDFFIEAYKRSGRYRPYIVAALKEAGLPEELSWLPLIESGFKVKALSHSRALGLWQFIPSTGYKFGLKRDKFIDERMDPMKSTQAAIDYLKELHAIFGDWTTVLAAYNCGEGKVLNVIRTQNVNYLDNFWDLYERLPRETARYVPRFLATLHILDHPEKFGLNLNDVPTPYQYETVSISKQMRLKDVASSIDVDEEILSELNPELRYKICPEEPYPLRVPLDKSEILMAQLAKIPIAEPPGPAYAYHRVRPGETLSLIAQRYRTSINSIMSYNDLRRSNYIVAGRLLKIPQRGYRYAASDTPTPKNDRSIVHVVKKGDSLWTIAKQYGTTTKMIQQLNHLATTELHKGQVLTISGNPEDPPKIDGLVTYEVQPGDSPFQIARRHNMDLGRFLTLNQLWPNDRIYPGQTVYVAE